jgi:hypothetical protein
MPEANTRAEKRDRLQKLSESEGDGHQCIRTRDGDVHEGWIDEIHESTLVFAYAPSPFYAQAHGTNEMAPPDATISLDDVVAWMSSTGQWIDL